MLFKFLRQTTALSSVAIIITGCLSMTPAEVPIGSNINDGFVSVNPTIEQVCSGPINYPEGLSDSAKVEFIRVSLQSNIDIGDIYYTQTCQAFAASILTWKAYRDAADEIASNQSLTNFGILGLSAATIWSAVSGQSTDTIALLGIATAAVYSGSSILAPEQKRIIYRAGAKAAACIMGEANALITHPAVFYGGELQKLMLDVAALSDKLKTFSGDIPEIKQVSGLVSAGGDTRKYALTDDDVKTEADRSLQAIADGITKAQTDQAKANATNTQTSKALSLATDNLQKARKTYAKFNVAALEAKAAWEAIGATSDEQAAKAKAKKKYEEAARIANTAYRDMVLLENAHKKAAGNDTIADDKLAIANAAVLESKSAGDAQRVEIEWYYLNHSLNMNNKELAARIDKTSEKIATLNKTLAELKRGLDGFNVSLAGEAAKITQTLIELDGEVRELLDQTLPNPALIFDDFQALSIGYMTRANTSFDFSDNNLGKASAKEEPDGGSKVGLLDSGSPGDPIDYENLTKHANVVHNADLKKMDLEIESVLASLNARGDEISIQISAGLTAPHAANYTECEKLGIGRGLILTEKELTLLPGDDSVVAVIGGNRPIRFTMIKRPAGLTHTRSMNADGDTEFKISWDGSGEEIGTYSIKLIDNKGAAETIKLDLKAGLGTKLTIVTTDEFELEISSGKAGYKLFLLGSDAELQMETADVGTYADFKSGAEIAVDKVKFKIKKAAAGVIKFYLVDVNGLKSGVIEIEIKTDIPVT